ncbi:glycoside hydrolase family 38 C-terminal domain-containing protein [Virgibacillus halophilus]|uniref:Glycoside hydrolase family 38 C-terminal domain-containing protein n=2 Tax=Tigheibacillus halophilus TaxID=361280 RepID=A0ABU5C355_9BACI|nr:glycoside hydrolase family 38 C-terminal domain-containing protein [Virgibacillus halophilus]
MNKYFRVLDQGATTDHIIIPNGHDQMPIQKNIFRIIEKLKSLYPGREFFLSKYENIFKELEKNESLPTIKGEFLDGKYMRVHRSIYSTRMDIKAKNTRVENKITNILEPLASIAYRLGFEYHHGLIELIWKEIMKNHAHDSIGCCCSDKVHREIINRLYLAEEKTDQLIAFYKRKITDSIQTDRNEDRLTAFNLLPYDRKEVITTTVVTKLPSFKLEDHNGKEIDFKVLEKEEIDPGLIDRQIVHYGNYKPFNKFSIQLKDTVPAMGYKTYFVIGAESNVDHTIEDNNSIETEHYLVSVNTNGTLKITDKQNCKVFDQVLLLENGGDDGDEYDYSPLSNEKIISNNDAHVEVKKSQNQFTAKIEIKVKLEIPSNLEKRKINKKDSSVVVTWNITIPNHQPLIKIKAAIENDAKDHRLRTWIPTGIASKFSVADNQFGLIKRHVVDPAMRYWEEEGWEERPDSIYPMLSFVGLFDDEHGISVLTNSTREYEILGDNHDTIAVTLFRSVGILGKENLTRRPGRPSGIGLATPGSQMIGKLELEFAITTHKGSITKSKVSRIAKEYTTEIQTYNKIPYNAMKLNPSGINTPASFSLLREMNSDTVLSVLKKAEKEDELVLRIYNPSEQGVECSFELQDSFHKSSEGNLNEMPISSVNVEDSKIGVSMKRNQVKTLLIK